MFSIPRICHLTFIALGLFTGATTAQPADTAEGKAAATDEVVHQLNGSFFFANRPIPDVKVDVYWLTRGESDETAKLLKSTTTNETGKFDLEVRLDGDVKRDDREYRLTLVGTKPGRASTMYRLHATRQEEWSRSHEMPPSASITGRVVDEKGQPIVDADVYTRYPGYGEPLSGVLHARTNIDGEFEINDTHPWTPKPPREIADGVFQGNMTMYLSVRKEGFASTMAGYKAVPVRLDDIELTTEAVIEGRVMDGDQPVAGINVELQNTRAHRGKGGTYKTTKTDATGRYRLAGLPAGPFNVWANTSDKKTAAALSSLAARAGETVNAPDILLIDGGWIEGKIVNQFNEPLATRKNGKPLTIGLHGPSRPNSGAAVQSVPVEANGTFRLRVPPGKNFPYIMSLQGDQTHITDENGHASDNGWVTVKEGEVKKLTYTCTVAEDRTGGDF